jgi:hypothetical protein
MQGFRHAAISGVTEPEANAHDAAATHPVVSAIVAVHGSSFSIGGGLPGPTGFRF